MTDEYKPHTKLTAVHFDRSVMFGSEMESASVWKPGSLGAAPSNSVDEIYPVCLDASGGVVNPNEKSARQTDGIVLRKRVHDLTTRQRVIKQTFVPWSNVRSVSYGE
jgi:hypothetical protein